MVKKTNLAVILSYSFLCLCIHSTSPRLARNLRLTPPVCLFESHSSTSIIVQWCLLVLLSIPAKVKQKKKMQPWRAALRVQTSELLMRRTCPYLSTMVSFSLTSPSTTFVNITGSRSRMVKYAKVLEKKFYKILLEYAGSHWNVLHVSSGK